MTGETVVLHHITPKDRVGTWIRTSGKYAATLNKKRNTPDNDGLAV
ncbi:MAG: hypothetical protein ABFC71_11020 [Methanoregula sp.]|jgi:hypothetical protein